jgi:hypothetical protein
MDTLLVPVPDAPYPGCSRYLRRPRPVVIRPAARPGKPDGVCRPLPDVTAATARSLRGAGVLARLAALARLPLPICSDNRPERVVLLLRRVRVRSSCLSASLSVTLEQRCRRSGQPGPPAPW